LVAGSGSEGNYSLVKGGAASTWLSSVGEWRGTRGCGQGFMPMDGVCFCCREWKL